MPLRSAFGTRVPGKTCSRFEISYFTKRGHETETNTVGSLHNLAPNYYENLHVRPTAGKTNRRLAGQTRVNERCSGLEALGPVVHHAEQTPPRRESKTHATRVRIRKQSRRQKTSPATSNSMYLTGLPIQTSRSSQSLGDATTWSPTQPESLGPTPNPTQSQHPLPW